MREEDLDRVLEIERSSFPQPWSPDHFLEELRHPFSKIVLAWSNRESRAMIVGYVCRWLTGDELHVLNVTVHPEWRRRAIGRRLITEVIAEARAAGAVSALLEVRRHNAAARALYDRVGFGEVGIRPNYYGFGQDAVLMELAL
ncbi:MAG: ribosomal protein S18-alanine N-acetyltransferase [Candidatus Binatia bacterium]